MQQTVNNRNRANIILATVFILFISATILKYIYRDSFLAGLLAFVAEAALVGGIADWFAVTALFRKPLGFSWHTAIIPNNREKIIEKVSETVSNELLNVDSIKSRLCGLNLVEAILDRLSGNMDRDALESQVQSFVETKAGSLDRGKISKDIDGFIKESLKKEDVSNEIRNLLTRAFAEGKHRTWLSGLLGKAVEIAGRASTKEKIYRILKKQERFNEENTGAGSFFIKTLLNASRNSRHTNLFTISEVLQQELISLLRELKNPQHPVFKKMLENSESLLNRLDSDHVLVQAIQAWKNGILDRVELMETLQYLVSSIIESNIYRNEAAQWAAEHLDRYREDLKQDDEMREWIDGILKIMLEKIIRNEHHLIGEIVKETLESFTNERLNRFVEEKAGNDLQWIRINGSIVGAAAGILIYLFINLFYSPYVVPLIQGLLGIS